MLGAPWLDVVHALGTLRGEDWKIIVHTSRGEAGISCSLTQNQIPHDEINGNSDYPTESIKPVADLWQSSGHLTSANQPSSIILLVPKFQSFLQKYKQREAVSGVYSYMNLRNSFLSIHRGYFLLAGNSIDRWYRPPGKGRMTPM